MLIKDAIKNTNDGLLYNKTFLVTGKLNGISRGELKSLIEENSGKIVSSVSKKLNYLIIGDKPTKKKIDNAKKNEPSFVRYTLNKLSELKNVDFDKLDKITTDNFNRLFFEI